MAARAEWDRRHSIAVADALAWQLHANRRDTEALTYADQALRLGTRNPLFLFHRAAIERSRTKSFSACDCSTSHAASAIPSRK